MLFNYCKTVLKVNFLGLLFLLTSACSQINLHNMDMEGIPPENIVFGIPDDVYRVWAGDRLSMVIVPKTGEVNYRINVGDTIDLNVQDREDLSVNYQVGPDGTIEFRQLKSMKVTGMTISVLEEMIKDAYHQQGINSYITLSYSKFNAPLHEVTKILTPTGVQNNVFTVTVEVDGKANFPIVGMLDIQGKTLQEANEFLAEKFLDIIDNVDVTLRLEDSSRHSVSIIGAVTQPGAYPVQGAAPLLEILASAKGYTDEARLGQVMTLQPRGNKVYINKFDLEDNIVGAATMKLVAGDVIYVPKKPISDVNRFVDQYVRRNVPILINLPLSVLIPPAV